MFAKDCISIRLYKLVIHILCYYFMNFKIYLSVLHI